MPIPVHCPGCLKKLVAPDKAAGKRLKCPHCQGPVMVAVQQSAALVVEAQVIPTPAVAAPPAERWQVLGANGKTYGPVARAELDKWCADGRLMATTQIQREGVGAWQWATSLYPDLAAPPQSRIAPHVPSPWVLVVAIYFYVQAGVTALFEVLALLLTSAVLSGLPQAPQTSSQEKGSTVAFFLMTVLYAGVPLLIATGLAFVGWGLQRRAEWARWTAIVWSGLLILIALPACLLEFIVLPLSIACFFILLNREIANEFRARPKTRAEPKPVPA
jgi:hypothetical protein